MVPGLEPADLPADAIEVGHIGEAWGIKGWFKVFHYSADPQALFCSRRWYVSLPGVGAATARGSFLLKVKETKVHADALVACAQDIDDRTTAEALKGARVFLPRTSFPSLGADEYYWVDLIGSAVTNRQGVALGQVHDLQSNGAQTVLLLHDVQSGKLHERMIPFVAAFVDKVDLQARQIVVDWQPDY